MTLTEEGLLEVEGMASRWVRLANGSMAHYMTSGTTGPSVVLLHGGLPGSSGTAGWRFMAPYLGERGFRVYCPDMPAFGLSDNRREYWPDGMHCHTDFIQEFTTALGLDRFHLAGNSMGCMNTVNYACAHPERVISFVLIAGDVGDVVPDGLKPQTKPKLMAYDGTREGMRSMMEAIIYRGEVISDELIEMRYRAAERQKEAHAHFWPGLREFGRATPWRDQNIAARLVTKGRLDRLDIPALYLFGTEDILSPVTWGYVQEKYLPKVQFFYPEECGHQGQTDRPDLFNPVFHEFFRDGKVTRQTADAAGVSKNREENPLLVVQA